MSKEHSMLNIFTKIFGGSVQRPRGPRKPRLGVEELTPRTLPSAGFHTIAAGGAFDQAARFAAFESSSSSTDTSSESQDGCGGHHGAEHATLSASLTNASGATGTASFNSSAGSLFVTVKGATASSTLSVTVTDNGTTTNVGTITTDASGNGHAKFTGVTAAAGDTVMVGDLTGTFAQVRFSATLTGTTTGVSGSAAYNSVKNSLHVSITGAAASTTYNVSINGTVIGQITTNSRGYGRLKVTPSGVTIASGSTISIADTTGSAAILTGAFA
jgi:hypothetical protein